MTKKKCLYILKRFNEWRRGADTKQLSPTLIGQALDYAIKQMEEK